MYSVRVSVQGEDLAPFAQQMHQVAPVAASGVEYTHAGHDVSAQNLVEYVDVYLTEVFLKTHYHDVSSFLWPLRRSVIPGLA